MPEAVSGVFLCKRRNENPDITAIISFYIHKNRLTGFFVTQMKDLFKRAELLKITEGTNRFRNTRKF